MPHPVMRTSTAPRPARASRPARRGRRVLALLSGVAAASVAVLALLQLTGGPSETSRSVAGPDAKTATPRPRQAVPVAKDGAPTPKITMSTKPASTTPGGVPATRRLAWAPVAGAIGYHVELFRGDERLLAQETKEPALELGRTWRYQRRIVTLTPGTYRWYVWAVTKRGRAAEAVVQAKLTV